ncbi:class I adenylate-forming enzyme family protein [Bacillus bombysepticus]
MNRIKTLLKEQINQGNGISIANDEATYSPSRVLDEINVISKNFKYVQTGEKIGLVIDHSMESLFILLTIINQECCVIPMDVQSQEFEIERISKIASVDIWILPDNHSYKLTSSFSTYTYTYVYQNTIQPNNYKKVNLGYIYMLTSGTKGMSKIAKIPYQSLWDGATAYQKWFEIQGADTILSTVPLTHSYGLIGACLGAFYSGATLYLCKNPTPRRVVSIIKKLQPTILFGVPVLYSLLNQANKIKKEDLASLRLLISSGGPLNNDVQETFYKKYELSIQQVYGSTETGMIAATHPNKKSNPKSVGYLLPHVRAEQDDKGHIVIKSKTMFGGYLTELGEQNPIVNNTYAIPDYGKIENNEVFLLGRSPSFINVAGRKVNPAEIENLLIQHPSVKEIRVIGQRDELYGEKIIAYVKSSGDEFDEFALKEYLINSLAFYKLPHEIKNVEEIPKGWKETYVKE